MEMTFEEFQRFLMEDRESLCRRIEAYVAEAENYSGDKNTNVWRNYEMNLSLQRAFCHELNRAAALPPLALEVLGTRYRLWNDFIHSVKVLNGESVERTPKSFVTQSASVSMPESQTEKSETQQEALEKEQDLTIYKDKHPAPPRKDDLAVVEEKKIALTTNPLPPRIKPKPTFHSSVEKKKVSEQPQQIAEKPMPRPVLTPTTHTPKHVRVADMKRVVPRTKTPPLAPKKPMQKPAQKSSAEIPPRQPQEKPVDITLGEDALKIRKGIIEKVAKTAKGFLDNIFGAIGNNDAGLSHIKDLRLSDIIEVEKLPPDAHAARLAELNVNQKEWGSWIDWVNESNRLVPANVSATLGQYLDNVSDTISKK